jgi:hypothetical protein
MTTMFSKLFLAGVFSTVLAAALALSPLASASTAPVRSTVSASGSAARVYAEDEKKKDDKKSKSEGKADSKKGGDKKPAPSGGW